MLSLHDLSEPMAIQCAVCVLFTTPEVSKVTLSKENIKPESLLFSENIACNWWKNSLNSLKNILKSEATTG